MRVQLRLLPKVLATARLETRAADALPRRWWRASTRTSRTGTSRSWAWTPDRQGRGFGSHLMQPVLERCDADGTPAYLETDTERNVQLYERHGFKVTEEFPLPGGGPPVWLMWREPA